ncbi:MAG: glycosyltransferase family 4 protein [Patescibacteria group bacterium]
MRIAIITQLYYPVLGGITEHVYYTYQELTKLGHQVTIITSHFMGRNYDRGADVIRIGYDIPVPIPMNGSFPEFNLGKDVPKELNKITRQKKFDLIHIHSPLTPLLPFIALKTIKGIPKVGTFHTFGRDTMLYQVFKYPLKTFTKELDGRIAVSPAAKKYISKNFPGNYVIISNGVDTVRFNPHNPEIADYDDDKFNILFVGRMDPRKGLRHLLLAFPYVKKQIKNARLIIVGGGHLKAYYKSFVTQEHKNDIIFEGYAPYDDLPKYYRTADIYCSPATGGESFGIVLIEAMASGTPIVASDIDGYRDVLSDGQEGLLTKNKDSKDLAAKIIKLAKNKKLREQMGQNGVKTSQKYGWPKVTKQIEGYYKEVLANYRKK